MTPTRWLIIDANVARSCSDPARHETSLSCHRLTQLLSQRDVTVGVALSPAMASEWRTHGSPHFVRWWARMESRRRIRGIDDRVVRDYRVVVDGVPDDGIRDALLHDMHLVEAAILNRYPISSMDNRQKRYLSTLVETYRLLADIQWFHPVESADWESWILSGCADAQRYRIAA